MPGYAWNGSAFKKVLTRHVWNGTAWVKVKTSHVWNGSAWQRIYSAFTPSGMIKSGGSTTASSGTLKQVTGMIADPAFPGSSITINALSVIEGKVDATINMSVNCQNSFTTTVTVAAYKNGVLLGTTLTRTGGSGTFVISGSTTGTVAAGDLITLMCSAANGTTTIYAADTFLNIT